MSHFTVLVIGPDHEKQLAPFHEFECTGINDEFVQDVDVTKEVLEEGLGYHGLEDSTVTDESQVEKDGDHKYGYAVVDASGNVIKAINRTNPNKKWDWYQVGGRWSGYFQLKPGAAGARGEAGLMGSSRNKGNGFADQTTKGAIDSDAMRAAEAKKAGEKWDKAFAAAEPLGGLKWEPWVKVREEMFKGDIDGARAFYNDQPVVKGLTAALDHPWLGVDEYLTPRDQYVQDAADQALAPYALLFNGEWIAKGEMGWFGFSNDTESQDDWNKKINALIDSLPDDTQLTLVDCHI